MELFDQLPLPGLHGHPVGVGGMVEAEQMQDAVHDEQGDLVIERAGVVRRVGCRHFGTDHEVAQQQREVFAIGAASLRAGPTFVGPPAALGELAVDRERQHVGGAVGGHEVAVESGNGDGVHEQNGQLDIAGDSLGRQHLLGQQAPARHVDGTRLLLIGDEHRELTLPAGASGSGDPWWPRGHELAGSAAATPAGPGTEARS